MSLTNDKKGILSKIGAFTSLKEERNLPNQTNSFSSINNKNEPIPYLLDVLKTVAGTEALKQMVGGMFTTFIDKAEPKLKTSLKKQFTQYNSDDGLPNNFKNNGISIPVKNIDPKSKFKVNPNSSNGSLLYDKVKPNFDKTAYDAILNDGTSQKFSVLTLNYNKTTDKFIVKPYMTSTNSSISNWFGEFIDDAVIINKKEIMTEVMDTIYGTITVDEEKTPEQVAKELELNKLIEKLIAGDENLELTSDEYDEISENAKELANGIINYDLGCGVLSASLSYNDMTNLISSISGSTDSNGVANAIERTITKSTSNNEILDENQETIKDGFFQKIIQIFTVKMLQAITIAPQVQVLLAIFDSFQTNGNPVIEETKNNLERYKIIVRCLIRDLMATISEYIFNIIVSYLIKLLTPTIKKIAKEKINQFKRIIKSLTTKKQ